MEASGPFLPRATWMASRAPLPGKRRGAGAQQLMTVGHCEWKNRGVIVKPSLFLEGLGHGQPHLQELRPRRRRRRLLRLVRRGNHGQRPQPPLPRPAQETSLRTTDTSTATRAHGRQHIWSTAPVPVVRALSVKGVHKPYQWGDRYLAHAGMSVASIARYCPRRGAFLGMTPAFFRRLISRARSLSVRL